MKASTVLRLASDLSPRPSDRTPIRGIFVACWVCAASGQVATAPPKRAMKARRCMSTPKFKRRHTAAKPSTLIGLILSSEAQPQWSTDVSDGSFSIELGYPRHVRVTPDSDRTAATAGGPFRADFVANVEIRTTPKISRKPFFGWLHRCKAP